MIDNSRGLWDAGFPGRVDPRWNELHRAKPLCFNEMSHFWADQTARMEVCDSKPDNYQKGPFFRKNWFDGQFPIAELGGRSPGWRDKEGLQTGSSTGSEAGMSFEINLLRRAGPPPKPNTDSAHPGFDRQEEQETPEAMTRQLQFTQGLLRTPLFSACPERREGAASAGLKRGAKCRAKARRYGRGWGEFTSKPTMCLRMSRSENDRPIRNSGGGLGNDKEWSPQMTQISEIERTSVRLTNKFTAPVTTLTRGRRSFLNLRNLRDLWILFFCHMTAVP
jgi:hypothetical protein